MVHEGQLKDDRLALDLPPLSPLIGGRWLEGERSCPVLDKYTGKVIAEVREASREQVSAAVRTARSAFEKGAPAPVERARILRRAAELMGYNRDRFASLMIAEAGFTRTDANGDIDRSLVTLNLSAEEATRIIGETVSFAASPGQHQRLGFTIRVPLGVICAITPFNSPVNTVLHKIAPAFAAGNAVVLKPSALTPLSAALLCEILLEAGMPPDFLALVQGEGTRVGSWLLEEQDIDFYSFTGSTQVGRIIHKAAGLRRTQLELGSIASTIVFADADFDRAIPKIAAAAFRKAGQVCTSTQRLYVENSVATEVTERLAQAASTMPAGDPRDAVNRIGPMISEQAAERAQASVDEAKLGNARVVQGGTRSGSVIQPTVVADIQAGMRIIDEEIFAPVVSVLPFDDLNQAIEHANNTPYGLSVGVFTSDWTRATRAAQSLRFGAIHINEASSSRADGMPFGGVKDSGFGREGPKYAIQELTEERLVTFNP